MPEIQITDADTARLDAENGSEILRLRRTVAVFDRALAELLAENAALKANETAAMSECGELRQRVAHLKSQIAEMGAFGRRQEDEP